MDDETDDLEIQQENVRPTVRTTEQKTASFVTSLCTVFSTSEAEGQETT